MASQDDFQTLIANVQSDARRSSGTEFQVPTGPDLRQWSRIFRYFRTQSIDSCRKLLATYDYTLTQIVDARSGFVYDVISENRPAKRRWGTFIYNRQHSRRMFVHVTHPADDERIAQIASDLFRRTRAEWLYLAGTRKNERVHGVSADQSQMTGSIFQRWHEVFTDLTHLTLSLHSFERNDYSGPIAHTDIVLSNGRTSDDQWGISQMSLALRDTMRSTGTSCAIAMYDSGFSSLAWGTSPQALFSNDSVGFGHWINVELSGEIRDVPTRSSAFIAAADRATDLTGKKVSQQVNRAFGLVAPRTVYLDESRRILFPPAQEKAYRVISFSGGSTDGDTLDIQTGGWMQFPSSGRSKSSVTRLDSTGESAIQQMRRARRSGPQASFAEIFERVSPELDPVMHLRGESGKDSFGVRDAQRNLSEPLQVQRIPLQHQMTRTGSIQLVSELTPYHWSGMVSPAFTPPVAFLEYGGESASATEGAGMPDLLIPIINRTYGNSENRVVGIQLSTTLVQHIARLVRQYQENPREIQLMAEETEEGEYFLRIFPEGSQQQIAEVKP